MNIGSHARKAEIMATECDYIIIDNVFLVANGTSHSFLLYIAVVFPFDESHDSFQLFYSLAHVFFVPCIPGIEVEGIYFVCNVFMQFLEEQRMG